MTMNVSLTPQLEELVRRKVDSGRYTSASEVVREALRLLDAFESVRASTLAKLREDVNAGWKNIEEGKVSGDNLRRLFVHSISADDVMVKLGVSSKLNADWDFLLHLHEAGRTRADAWIAESYDRIGRESTADIRQQYL